MSKTKILFKLFISTFLVSATTSGGHAITAVLKPLFTEKYHWLSEEEYMNLASIGQATPGSIAINVSVILGYRMAGLAGAFLTLIGTTIPPFAFMLAVTIFYEKIVSNPYVAYFMGGMQASVTALMVFMTIDSFKTVHNVCGVYEYIIMAVAFIYTMFTNYSLFYLFAFIMIAAFVKTYYLTRYFK